MVRSNLFYRVSTAIILTPIALLLVFKATPLLFFLVVFMLVLGSVFEFGNILDIKGYERVLLFLTSASTYFFVCYFGEKLLIYISILFSISAMILLYLYSFENFVERVGRHLFCNLYIPLLWGFVYRLFMLERGREWLFFLLVVNWLTDTFAYFIGTKFGKHKFTNVSPKKSIEGLVGGIGGAIVAAVFTNFLLFKSDRWVVLILLGFLGAIIGQLGDLIESGIKRSKGVKDSGTLIPGHGGVLDRFDSVIFSGFFFYLFATSGLIK